MNLLEEIKKFLPNDIGIQQLCFEGTNVVLYTNNKEFFTKSGYIIKEAVNKFKKRIEVRPVGISVEPEEAKKIIKSLIPKDADLEEIYFEPEFGKVIITCKKPGLVIGKDGFTLKEIKKRILWVPQVDRIPSIRSDIVKNIRANLHEETDYRKKFMIRIGKSIHEKKKETDWIRITTLGGYREVGRSCELVQTPQTKLLTDCGVDVGKNSFPYLQAPEFEIENLDGSFALI